jgi:hypothetical protein
MRQAAGHILEIAGVAAVVLGVTMAAHHLQIEVPIVSGVAAIYIGKYLKK